MARAAPSLSAFNSGELSPLLAGRSTGNFEATYKTGCRIMENFLATIQGPAIGRGGTKFVAEVKQSNDRTWLVRFIFSASQAFVLEFGDEYIRFYTERAQVLSGMSIYEIATPYAVEDLTNADGSCALSFKQSGDVIYIACDGYPPQKLQRFGNTNWVIEQYKPKNGPFKKQNVDQDFTVTGLTYAANVTGAADNGSGLIRLTVNTTTDLTDGDWVRVASVGGTEEANGRWKATKISATEVDLQGSAFTNAYTSGGEIRTRSEAGNTIKLTASQSLFLSDHVGSLIQLEESDLSDIRAWEVDKPVNRTELRRSDSKTYEALTTGKTGSTKPVHTSGSKYDGSDDPGTGSVVEGVQWLYNDSGIGNVEITTVTSDTEAVGIIRENLPYELTLNQSTFRWAMQAWSAVEGWPCCVTIFRERLAFAKGFEVYLSVSGDFENMALKQFGEILADSAMILPVLNDETNGIQWIHPVSGGLLVATAGGESLIHATSISEPLGPENVEVDPQSSHGSRAVNPVSIGPRIMFIQRSGRKLYDALYSVTSEKYEGTDQTIRANHITQTGIVDMVYQQDPHSILWAVRSDGGLTAFTTMAAEGVAAWHRHPIGGNGIVESVQSIPSPDGLRDDLWLIVRRTIDGQTKRYVEVMMPEIDDGDAIEDSFYVDSGLTYSGVATDSISGLSHLEGEVVKVLVDGSAHPDRTVESGAILLQESGTKIHVGLGYRRRISPMRLEAGAANGTAQTKTKRSNRIGFRFHNTVGAKVGPSIDKLQTVPFRNSGMAMDSPIPLYSGDKLVKWNGGYDSDHYIEVVHDDPLPITLIGIYPQVTTYDQR